MVAQIFDQYLDYIVLEPSLFSLLPGPPSASSAPVLNGTGEKNGGTSEKGSAKPPTATTTTYERLNDPKSGEREIEEETERIAKGLFSAMATLGALEVHC